MYKVTAKSGEIFPFDKLRLARTKAKELLLEDNFAYLENAKGVRLPI